jgi:hypothetical protein
MKSRFFEIRAALTQGRSVKRYWRPLRKDHLDYPANKANRGQRVVWLHFIPLGSWGDGGSAGCGVFFWSRCSDGRARRARQPQPRLLLYTAPAIVMLGDCTPP